MSEITVEGSFRPSDSYDELMRVMEEQANAAGTLGINLPGKLPFIPKYVILNGVKYERVEEEVDASMGGGVDGGEAPVVDS